MTPNDANDARLLRSVRPADWVNPTPKERYHLVVIGAGTAGLVSAAGAATLGAKVALIERRYLGGDCLNFGCVPSKALLRAGRAVADVRRSAEFGVEIVGDVRVNFAAIMDRMRRLRADISPNDSVQRFRDLGVDVFLGDARFTGSDSIAVAEQTLRFARAIIATGTRPMLPAIPGLNEAGVLTNETIFNLTTLPASLAVIGAGPIGCELAQAFARFGSRVTLIGNHSHVLPREDVAASEILAKHLERDGVELLLDARIDAIESTDAAAKIVRVYHRGERVITADAILVAAGRVPNVEGLDLGTAGIQFDPKAGVIVDDRLRTTNARVYAAGDICSRFKFTHAADAYARIAVRNALFLGRAKASDLVIPWCTYTDPEVSQVGLTEAEALARGIAVDVFTQPFTHIDRAILDGDTDGFAKVLVRKGSDAIIGATIVSRHAGDMIGEVALAMTGKLGLKAIANTVHPYPTHAEALRKLGDAHNRTRLTPTVRWLFQKWFAWT